MNDIPRTYMRSYALHGLIEFPLVVIILTVLVGVAADIMSIQLKSVKLVEPIQLVREIQTNMVVDAAFTGQWPKRSELAFNLKGWEHSVRGIDVNEFGNIAVTLHESIGLGQKNVLGFNLIAQENNMGFRFYRWRCGESSPLTSIYVSRPVTSTVPSIISHTICRD